MNSIASDLERFYAILARLTLDGKQGRPLREYSGKAGLPARGVYFFREPGEYRFGTDGPLRIVRVGTHAVSLNAKSSLWGRLRTHLGTRSGSGNHRGSIFRLHVGNALLSRDEKVIESWGAGRSVATQLRADSAAMAAEGELERRVSEYIGAMSILWVDVPDLPSSDSVRSTIEKNAIALLSNRKKPMDIASANWLGKHSPREEIRQSHLWNLNYVDGAYDPAFLDQLELAVQSTSF